MKLPAAIFASIKASNGDPMATSQVAEAIVRDCANQYQEWIAADTLTTFEEWLCYRYGLEPKT